MARTPSGKPQAGEQKNQRNFRTGVATIVASLVIDPGVRIKRAGGVYDVQAYEVIALKFEDAGGAVAETAQRASSVKNADGTFTIYLEKAAFGTTDWVVATGTNTVRWTILMTG